MILYILTTLFIGYKTAEIYSVKCGLHVSNAADFFHNIDITSTIASLLDTSGEHSVADCLTSPNQ